MPNTWDHEADLIVVGSGAAGMACALTASSEGLDVLVVEKTDRFGGTTALSGGVLWIPDNSLMNQAGLADSADQALTYLQHNIGNRVGEAKLAAFVSQARTMLDYLIDRGYLEVEMFDGFPDYRPETPGGVDNGRSVEPRVFPGRTLGGALAELREPPGIAHFPRQ